MSIDTLERPGIITEGGTATIERTVTSDGDHDRFAHYAPKKQLTDAMVFGIPIQALCGKIWVPSRDPNNYPLCGTCKEIWTGIPAGNEE